MEFRKTQRFGFYYGNELHRDMLIWITLFPSLWTCARAWVGALRFMRAMKRRGRGFEKERERERELEKSVDTGILREGVFLFRSLDNKIGRERIKLLYTTSTTTTSFHNVAVCKTQKDCSNGILKDSLSDENCFHWSKDFSFTNLFTKIWTSLFMWIQTDHPWNLVMCVWWPSSTDHVLVVVLPSSAPTKICDIYWLKNHHLTKYNCSSVLLDFWQFETDFKFANVFFR